MFAAGVTMAPSPPGPGPRASTTPPETTSWAKVVVVMLLATLGVAEHHRTASSFSVPPTVAGGTQLYGRGGQTTSLVESALTLVLLGVTVAWLVEKFVALATTAAGDGRPTTTASAWVAARFSGGCLLRWLHVCCNTVSRGRNYVRVMVLVFSAAGFVWRLVGAEFQLSVPIPLSAPSSAPVPWLSPQQAHGAARPLLWNAAVFVAGVRLL